jgi:hypothetical protein
MATQWPVLTARLVVLLPTLSGWSGVSVFDGPPVTGDVPTSYCTVGYVEDDDAGSYTDDLSEVGNVFTTETGSIRCRLVVTSGDVDISTVRTAAFALVDALRTSLRTAPLVGVLPAGSTTSLAVDVGSVQNERGSGQRLDFTVSYACPVI